MAEGGFGRAASSRAREGRSPSESESEEEEAAVSLSPTFNGGAAASSSRSRFLSPTSETLAARAASSFTERVSLCEELSVPAQAALCSDVRVVGSDAPVATGFALYAAFSEALFSLADKIDSEQQTLLHKHFTEALEKDLPHCVRAATKTFNASALTGRKRRRVGAASWRVEGCIDSYNKDGKNIHISVKDANIETKGLTLNSRHLILASIPD